MSASWKYRAIATVVKTHGRKGEVVVAARDGLPFLLANGMEVCLVPPPLKGPRRFAVTSCSGDGDVRRVKFDGVDDLSVSTPLVGRTVMVRLSALPDHFVLLDAMALIGRELHDRNLGPLGLIEEVMRGPANDVWVVRGAYGEVLVPAVDAFVTEMPNSGPIVVDLPDGLVGEGAVDDQV